MIDMIHIDLDNVFQGFVQFETVGLGLSFMDSQPRMAYVMSCSISDFVSKVQRNTCFLKHHAFEKSFIAAPAPVLLHSIV